jgi:hypothetical protein
MMQKNLSIAVLLILTTNILVSPTFAQGQPVYNFNVGQQAGAPAAPVNQPALIANQQGRMLAQQNPPLQAAIAVQDLAGMQQIYASQPTNIARALYISAVLDNDANNITIEQKINQAKILVKIVNSQISLLSGWFWTEPANIPQINWLGEQKKRINASIQQLEEQSMSFGMKFAWKTAKWTTLYLGIILAAYVGQTQLNNYLRKQPNSPDTYQNSYADLAVMPVEQLLSLAKFATIQTYGAATGPTAQKAVSIAGNAAKAGYQAAGSAASGIQKRIVGDINVQAKEIVKATESKPGKPDQYPSAQNSQRSAPANSQSNSADKGQAGTNKEDKDKEPKLSKDPGVLEFVAYKWDKFSNAIQANLKEASQAVSNYTQNSDEPTSKDIEKINKKYADKEKDFALIMAKKNLELQERGLPTMEEQEHRKQIKQIAQQAAQLEFMGQDPNSFIHTIAQKSGDPSIVDEVEKIYPAVQKTIMKDTLAQIQKQKKEAAEMEKLKQQLIKELQPKK